MTLQRTAPDVLGEKFDLNERQALFVYHYTADPERNATQAAKDAGYSERSAHTTAGRLLKIEKMQNAIAFCYQSTTEKLEITRERVLEEIGRIAFSQITDVLSFDEEGVHFKSSEELSPEVVAAIAEVRSDVDWLKSFDGETEEAVQKVKLRLKLHDKLSALEKLAKVLKLYGEEEGDVHNHYVIAAPPVRNREEWMKIYGGQNGAHPSRQEVIDAAHGNGKG